MIKKIRKKLNLKTTSLLVGGFLITFLFWATTRRIFSYTFRGGGSFENLLFLMAVALVFFVFNLAWHGISSFLIKKRWTLIFTLFVSQVGYLFLFGNYFFGWVSYLILVFTFWLWSFRARKDFSTRSEVLPLRSINFGLKTAITLFLIVISFSFYIHTNNRTTDEELIKKLRDFSVESIERVFSLQLKEFSPGMSFEQLVSKSAKDGVLGNYLAGGVKPDQVDGVVVDTLRKKYEKRFGVSFKNEDSVDVILGKVVEKRIRDYFDTYSQYIPYALVAVLFLGLKLFTLLYFWLVKLFSFFLFQLFLKTGFARIIKKKETVEKLQT